jgi:hypothetical protein
MKELPVSITRRQFLVGASAVLLTACGSSRQSNFPTTSTKRSAGVPATATTVPKPKILELVKRVKVGCYVNQGSQANPIAPSVLDAFEKEIGKQLDIVHYFFAWGSSFNQAINANVPIRQLMISWDPGVLMSSIAAGKHDAYITSYATEAKAYGHPVYLRFAAEMNGEWNSYSSSASDGPHATTWVAAWIKVYDLFKAAGASNVKFIWCPSETDSPDTQGNHLENYWPGYQWVDIMGFDAYNWSTKQPRRGNGGWRTFDQIGADVYSRIVHLAPHKPVWVCEFGCSERVSTDPRGVTKGQWFEQMFASRDYPNLEAVIYFSADDPTLNRDWRINSSKESLEGWRAGWLKD